MKKGFSILEVLVALLVVGLIVYFALDMLNGQNANMLNIRQRVQTQTAARDGLKILESELRATGFEVALSYTAAANNTLEMGVPVSSCPGMADPLTGSSVMAADGSPGENDTLDIAYPTVVSPTTGADCSKAQWSRYLVDATGNLVRITASSRAGLTGSTQSTIVGRNVDVFQARMVATGIASTPRSLLGAADSCCASDANWTKTGVTTLVDATAKTDLLTLGTTWSFLSKPVGMSPGDRWRIHFSIVDADATLLSDLKANSASYVRVGLFSCSTGEDAVLPILTQPDNAKSVFGEAKEIDIVAAKTGTYCLGFKGSLATAGTKLTLKDINAIQTGIGIDSTWQRDPVDLAAGDWQRTKAVRIQVVTRAPSDARATSTSFTGLANYLQSSSSTPGTFSTTDANVRVLLDHIYPVGNNGSF